MPKGKRKKRSNSGFFGVKIHLTKGNKYEAWIYTDGKTKSIGSYDTPKQAAKAHDKVAIKLRRPFSKLNYPKEAPVGYTPIQQPLLSTNTVGYRGVSATKKGKKFFVQVWIDGKNTRIGTYDTAKEAAIAYDRTVLKANKCTTLLNFPDMVHNLDVEPKRKKQKVMSTNTSGYKGVRPSGQKFSARIYTSGKTRHLGSFDTAIEAAFAYDQAAIKIGNKSHTLNFTKEEFKNHKLHYDCMNRIQLEDLVGVKIDINGLSREAKDYLHNMIVEQEIKTE